MLVSLHALSGATGSVKPVSCYRKQDGLGHRLLRQRKRRNPLPKPDSMPSSELRVDAYA